MVSLDGFFEGPNHELDWHNVDAEFNEYAIEQTKQVDILLFGRRTYELMASYWPAESAKRNDPIVAELMNTTPKIVFSTTLEKAEWNSTRLIRDNVAEEITKLKQQPGKDLAIYGSNNFAVSLVQMGLIDEFRIMVNPVALGNGNPLFKGIKDKLNLKLLKTRTFSSGNVLLCYQLDMKTKDPAERLDALRHRVGDNMEGEAVAKLVREDRQAR